ncbi:MAG: PQQ-dependent sugar dehydrogenase, partial [Gemmatimonadota bacterium]
NALQPVAAETVANGFPDIGGHDSHALALGDSNALFMNMGSYGNVCNGADPCSQLDLRAAIWKFKANGRNQVFGDGMRYASGIRNAVGLAWNQKERALFATQHGRDGLERFRQHFADRNVDDLPAEEFMRVSPGADFGWPYCYYDAEAKKKVLAPEYGGDGKTEGRCADKSLPLIGFPGHWAPDGLLFYTGSMFPPHYRDGAFITFHGSWNRREQGGYNVSFVPFDNGTAAASYEVFADGFAGRSKSPGAARHRPVGLALAPDGSLYITDDQRGRIWNVRFTAPR